MSSIRAAASGNAAFIIAVVVGDRSDGGPVVAAAVFTVTVAVDVVVAVVVVPVAAAVAMSVPSRLRVRFTGLFARSRSRLPRGSRYMRSSPVKRLGSRSRAVPFSPRLSSPRSLCTIVSADLSMRLRYKKRFCGTAIGRFVSRDAVPVHGYSAPHGVWS